MGRPGVELLLAARGKDGLSPTAFREYLFKPDAIVAFLKLFIGDRLAVDFVGRYEALEADYRALIGKTGIDEPPPLPRLKSGVRPAEARDYRQFYDDAAREFVATKCPAVIGLCGFESRVCA